MHVQHAVRVANHLQIVEVRKQILALQQTSGDGVECCVLPGAEEERHQRVALFTSLSLLNAVGGPHTSSSHKHVDGWE